MPRISSKHQVTLPVESLEAAGLRPGDEATSIGCAPKSALEAARAFESVAWS